jgi:hypothetical protein
VESPPCASPSKEGTRLATMESIRSHDSWFAKKRTCCPEISSYQPSHFKTKGPSQRRGAYFTDFWHTVQFSRSGTRPHPSSNHPTAAGFRTVNRRLPEQRSSGALRPQPASRRGPTLAPCPFGVNRAPEVLDDPNRHPPPIGDDGDERAAIVASRRRLSTRGGCALLRTHLELPAKPTATTKKVVPR